MKVLVLTISDRASEGVYEDKSGPAIAEVLGASIGDIQIERMVVPDDPDGIRKAFEANLSMDFIITTGGTGIGPRDNTPDVTADFCDRMIPGIAELMRAESLKQTIHASLSRAVAGIKGETIIVNFPGSVRGAKFCTELLAPIMIHAKKMISGEGH